MSLPPQGCCATPVLLGGVFRSPASLRAALAPRGFRGELRPPINPVVGASAGVAGDIADLEAQTGLHGRFLVGTRVALRQDAGFHALGSSVRLREALAGEHDRPLSLVAPTVRVGLVDHFSVPVALQAQSEHALAGMGAVHCEVRRVGANSHELAAVDDCAGLVADDVACFPVHHRRTDEARDDLPTDGAVHASLRRGLVRSVHDRQLRLTHRGATELGMTLEILIAERE